ncbi:MAG TPA: hypothetical protein VGA53_02325 [Candidatus Paceibacterota bacterium]
MSETDSQNVNEVPAGTPPQNPRNKKLFLWVVVGVVAAVLALGGFLLWQNVSNQVTHTPDPSPAPAPSLQPQAIDNEQSEIDTSGWQTYRNDEFGFEVKYPAYLNDINEGVNKESFSARSGDDPIFSIKVISNEPSLEDYLKRFNDSRTAEHTEFDPVVILKEGATHVGIYGAIQYETAQYAAPSFSIETYLQGTNGTIVRLTTTRLDKDIDDSMRQLNDQILSTFRFVE